MHFWVFATRGYGGFSVPRKYGLNWFIPALANSRVGSLSGTTGLDGTNVCPCFLQKKSMNCLRISVEESMSGPRRYTVLGAAAAGEQAPRPVGTGHGNRGE